MPDARRRMLDSLAAVSERVDYAGRVHATPEAARERGELDRQERERPVQSFRRTS
jgi:hypothetical protein